VVEYEYVDERGNGGRGRNGEDDGEGTEQDADDGDGTSVTSGERPTECPITCGLTT
jgi:hypothetical protein